MHVPKGVQVELFSEKEVLIVKLQLKFILRDWNELLDENIWYSIHNETFYINRLLKMLMKVFLTPSIINRHRILYQENFHN